MPLHRARGRTRAVPPPGDARRTDHVGGHDQLRSGGLGQRSQRLSLQLARSADRPGLAADAARVRAPGARRGDGACGFPDFVPDACLDQSLFAGQPRSPRTAMPTSRTSRSPSCPCRWDCPRVSRSTDSRAAARAQTVALTDGDVLVWGGPSRLVYHAVRPIKPGTHPLTGELRYNLTFRHAR